jgi:hypothetical protein
LALPKLEVKAFRRRQHAGYGYVGYEWVDVQQLGYRRFTGFGGWVAVDEEIVPNDVGISIGAFGSYDGPWRSKFLNWIPEAQGGHAEKYT